MAVRQNTRARRAAAPAAKTTAAPGRRSNRGTPAATKTTRRAAPEPVEEDDYSELLEKEPTPYHEAFDQWLTEVVGFNPAECRNKGEAFLMGVSLGTSARSDFQKSDWLAEWREENGQAKRGPKGKQQEEPEAVEEEEADDADFEEELNAVTEELNALTLPRLKARAKKEGVTVAAGAKKSEIIEDILDVLFPEEDEEEDGEEVDLEALREQLTALTLPQVRKAAGEYGLTYERTDKKTDIIEAILESVGEESEEDEEDEELEEEDEFADEDGDEEDEDEEEEPPAKPGRRTVRKPATAKTTRAAAPKAVAGKKGKYVF